MNHTYLGIVEYSWISGDGRQNAHIQPMARLASDGSDAKPLLSITEEFPVRGKVTWLDSEYETGDYILFTPREGGTFSPEQGKRDKYIIDRGCLPPEITREVADFFDDGVNLREVLVVYGVTEKPLGNSLYIRLDKDRIAGPVYFQEREGAWRIDVDHLNKSPLKVFLYDELSHAFSYRNRKFLRPGQLAHSGQIDWADPNTVLARTLNRIAKRKLPALDALRLNKKAIEILAADLSSLELEDLDRRRIEDSRLYLEQLGKNVSLSEDVLATLLKLPRVSEQIISTREALLLEARESAALIIDNAKKDAAESIRNLEQESTRLTRAIEENTRALNRSNAEIEARKHYEQDILDEQLKEFRTALSEKVEDLLSEPTRVLADMAIFRAAFQDANIARKPRLDNDNNECLLPQRLQERDASLETIEAATKKCRRFITHATSIGIMRTLISGAVPIIPASKSYGVIHALEQCLVGGSSLRILIPPTITSVSQLFIDRGADATLGPSSNGLSDLIIEATEDPDRLFLVVLEGINRAAVSLYLTPLLQLYSGEVEFLRVFRQGAIPPHSPFGRIANLSWPSNVLILVTSSDADNDFTALPVPSEMWRFAIPVNPEYGVKRSAESTGGGLSRVTYTEWRSHDANPSQSISDTIEDIRDELTNSEVQLDDQIFVLMSNFLKTNVIPDRSQEIAHFRYWLSVIAPSVESTSIADILQTTYA